MIKKVTEETYDKIMDVMDDHLDDYGVEELDWQGPNHVITLWRNVKNQCIKLGLLEQGKPKGKNELRIFNYWRQVKKGSSPSSEVVSFIIDVVATGKDKVNELIKLQTKYTQNRKNLEEKFKDDIGIEIDMMHELKLDFAEDFKSWFKENIPDCNPAFYLNIYYVYPSIGTFIKRYLHKLMDCWNCDKPG